MSRDSGLLFWAMQPVLVTQWRHCTWHHLFFNVYLH